MTQLLMPGIEPPARPKLTQEMILTIATTLCIEHSWPVDGAEDLAEEWRPTIDAYELAKALEGRRCWAIEYDMLEHLDTMSDRCRSAQRDAEKEWVKQYNIKPPLPIGARIQQGTIAAVSTYSPAAYEVKENGCVQEGRYLIIKFEDAQPI